MFASKVAARTAIVAARANTQRQQRRGIIDYITNYPDKVNELKKVQVAGGVCQGESNPTWLKQPGDVAVAGFGGVLVLFGLAQLSVGLYRLASGKGKMS